VIILQTGLNSGLSNIFLKSSYTFLTLIIISLSVKKHGFFTHKSVIPIIIFFLFYSIRLFIDVSLRKIEMLAYSGSYVYSYYFGATLIPCLAIFLSYKSIDLEKIFKISFYFLVLSNLLFFFHMLMSGEKGIVEMFAGRAQIIDQDKGDAFTVINPITLGVYGSSLIVFIFSLIVTKSRIFDFSKWIYFTPLIFVGIANMLIGASRGPLFSFFIVALILILFYLKNTKKNISFFLKAVFGTSLCGFFLIFFVSPLVEKYDIFLIQRIFLFLSKIDSGEKEYRDYAFESAINDFKGSPIYGNQYVGTYDNFYPHNFPIEILMSLGIVGGLLYLAMAFNHFRSFKKIWSNHKQFYKLPIFSLSILWILQSFTSGTIIANPEYWILLSLSTLLPYIVLEYRKEQIKVTS
jgi:hypothetical protein